MKSNGDNVYSYQCIYIIKYVSDTFSSFGVLYLNSKPRAEANPIIKDLVDVLRQSLPSQGRSWRRVMQTCPFMLPRLVAILFLTCLMFLFSFRYYSFFLLPIIWFLKILLVTTVPMFILHFSSSIFKYYYYLICLLTFIYYYQYLFLY